MDNTQSLFREELNRGTSNCNFCRNQYHTNKPSQQSPIVSSPHSRTIETADLYTNFLCDFIRDNDAKPTHQKTLG